ncbi:MAG: response regulator transcription factor [Actinobacteria bacterium]|nr:response regulator transcription factor [Actinomycetota bacterium]
MDEITVVIADDHTIVRRGLRKIMEEARVKVIGEVSCGTDVVKMASELQPDVILMDIEMPEMDGIEATRKIKQENPSGRIVVLTMHEEKEYLFKAIKAGALGYVLKDRAPEELVETVKAASKGMSLLQPSMASEILKEFAEIEARKDEQFRLYSTLTIREKEILSHLTQGLSNKEIAKSLFISDKTVRNHLKNIFDKLHINDRTTAAVIAIRQGLA